MANMPSIMESENETIDIDLEKLRYDKRKRVKLFLHATALTDYVGEGKILRALRIQKSPGMFQVDDTYKCKWAAILNQCSCDLMLLIIQRSKEEVAHLKDEIEKNAGRV